MNPFLDRRSTFVLLLCGLASLQPRPAFAQGPCIANALAHTVGVSTPVNSGVLGSYVPALTLPVGNYRYFYSASGTVPLVNFFLALNSTMIAWTPGATTYLPTTPNTVSFNFYIPTAQPLCSSKTVQIAFNRQIIGSTWVTWCTFGLNVVVVENGERRNLTFVKGSSRAYYAGSDGHAHALTWNPGAKTWDYAAVNVANGWGTVQIGGQMANFDDGSRLFFKGKNGRLYNLVQSGSSWTLSEVLPGVLTGVAGNVAARGNDEVVFFGADNKLHQLLLVNGTWSDNVITVVPPVPDGTSIQVVPGTSSIYFVTNLWLLAVHNTSNGWILETVGPPHPTWSYKYESDLLVLDNNAVYYKGRDNFIHRYVRGTSGWVFDPMTISPVSENNVVLGTGHLTKFPGEDRVFYKAGTGRIYNVYLQNGTWYNYPLRDPVTTTAGDLIAAENKIFYINHDRRVHNFYWENNAWWDVPLSGTSPANTRGCIRPYYS